MRLSLRATGSAGQGPVPKSQPLRRSDPSRRSAPLADPVVPVQQQTWGIIRYAPESGLFCDEDAAAFDGWYSERGLALRIAEDWVAKHPGWIVGLVSSDLIWFPNMLFRGCRNRPLTVREIKFTQQSGGQL